jgi:hypothetical protein
VVRSRPALHPVGLAVPDGVFRLLDGAGNGAFALLNSKKYGTHGPAPFLKSWVEPNLRSMFTVGIDVHNPPNQGPSGPWGNY